MKFKILFVLLTIFILIAACSNQSEVELMDFSYWGVEPILVEEIPDGFVLVDCILEQYRDILFLNFSGSRASFSDVDNNHLTGWFIDDTTAWVRYGNFLYIDESLIGKILPSAMEAVEARDKVYLIGEPIGTFNRRGNPAIITINSVSYANSFEDLELEGDEWVCIVKFSLDNHNAKQIKETFENERLSEHFLSLYSGWRFFHHAVTADGEDAFDVVQINEPFKIVLRLSKGVYVETLYIQSHDSAQVNIRRVDIRQ